MRKVVANHNQSLGFASNSKQSATTKNEEKASLWTRYISSPLKQFLQKHFQNKDIKKADDTAVGNIAVVAIRLSEKPEANKEMILNMKWQSGDKSLKLLEGERLAFNLQNWEQPAYLLIPVSYTHLDVYKRQP